MDAKNILVIGIKGSVIAFRRDTGEQLWATHLKSSSFVTVVTDEKRVYAHTGGELFCVDLVSGSSLWRDGLKGFGYGVASAALPGVPAAATATAVTERHRQEQAAAQTTSHNSSST
jgi:outer membrane protein assembly factor BamB